MTTPNAHIGLSNGLFAVIVVLYFVMNVMTILVAGIAIRWYFESRMPVVDWDDPDGPGYRIIAQTPDTLEVRWIKLRALLDCPTMTQLTIIGHDFAENIAIYPAIIDAKRRTFTRKYHLPTDLPEGQYELRIIDKAECNPLFFNIQTLSIPFKVPAR